MRTTRLLSTLIALSVMLPAAGCTRVLNDGSAISIVGTPPPPPPPPEPEPEPEPKLVEVTADAIVIHDKIQFEFGKSTIREESFGLLDEIVKVFKENPRIKKVSVEGHTDDVGSERSNQKLSDARAASVVTYLTEHGIEPERLSSVGYGESKPLDPAETDEARAKNRRVEFKITEQDTVTKTVKVDPETGEQIPVEQ